MYCGCLVEIEFLLIIIRSSTVYAEYLCDYIVLSFGQPIDVVIDDYTLMLIHMTIFLNFSRLDLLIYTKTNPHDRWRIHYTLPRLWPQPVKAPALGGHDYLIACKQHCSLLQPCHCAVMQSGMQYYQCQYPVNKQDTRPLTVDLPNALTGTINAAKPSRLRSIKITYQALLLLIGMLRIAPPMKIADKHSASSPEPCPDGSVLIKL